MLPSPSLPPNRVQPISGMAMPPQFGRMMPRMATGGRPRYATGGITVANSPIPALSADAAAAYPTLPAVTPTPSVPQTPQPFSSAMANVPMSALSGGQGSNGIIAPVNNQGIAQGTPSAPTVIPNNIFAPPTPTVPSDATTPSLDPMKQLGGAGVVKQLNTPNYAKGGAIPQYRNNYAMGGPPTSSQMAPWYTRSEAHDQLHVGGLFGGHAPGRADTLPRDVPVDSHVIPADAVAAIGQGNTLAGGNILSGMFHSEPYGISSGGAHHGSSLRLPIAPHAVAPEWRGGRKTDGGHKTVPIAASSGEFLIHPSGVYRTGMTAAKNMKLDPHNLTARKVMDIGHDVIDKFILQTRKKEIQDAKKRPAPKKD